MNVLSRLCRAVVVKTMTLILGVALLIGIAETLRHFDTPLSQHPLLRQTVHKPM